MSWLKGVLIGFDQLGNAIAGGNPDVTISARTGYNAAFATKKTRFFWSIMETVIDFIFRPVDGPGHCFNAYLTDQGERHKDGSDIARGILALIVACFSIPLFIVNRAYAAIARIKV